MQRIILLLLLFLSSTYSYGQEIKKVTSKHKNPSFKETYYVLEASPKIKHGAYTRTSEGKLQVKGQYENNNRVGLWEFYGWRGQLSQKFNFSTNEVEYDSRPSKQSYDTLKYAKPPLYPGGSSYLSSQWANNLRYPSEAIRLGIQGEVILKLIIDQEGNLTDVNVIKGIGHGCDEEAIKMFKILPDKWIPALDKEGNVVASEIEIPFKFQLQK